MKNLLTDFLKSNSELAVSKIIDYLDDELLNYPECPQEVVEYIKAIFSDETYWRSKDSWKLIHMLPAENLSARQFEEICQTLSTNFIQYDDHILSDMACDFIGRVSSPSSALKIFQDIAKQEIDEQHIKCILVGLNVVMHSDGLDSNTAANVKKLADQIAPKI